MLPVQVNTSMYPCDGVHEADGWDNLLALLTTMLHLVLLIVLCLKAQ
jgi:hypothetical protein